MIQNVLRVSAMIAASLLLLGACLGVVKDLTHSSDVLMGTETTVAGAVLGLSVAWLANRFRGKPITVPAVLLGGIGSTAALGLVLQLALNGTYDLATLGVMAGGGAVGAALAAVLVWGVRGPLPSKRAGHPETSDGVAFRLRAR